MLSILFILAIIGCAISIYAYITEEKVKRMQRSSQHVIYQTEYRARA